MKIMEVGMYIKRAVEKTLVDISKSFPCIVVYGPRQVGKSTTVNRIFGDKFKTVTLDDIDDRSLAQSNPKIFLETYGWPLIIDEIQKVPSLLDEIKKQIDNQRLYWLKNNKKRKLMYVLTGSNRFELQQGISDSLAGRCGVVEMASFSQVEKNEISAHFFTPKIDKLIKLEQLSKLKYKTRKQIFEEIFNGGMPDIYTEVSEREVYFKSYVATYIEKDVKKMISATSEMQFRN